MIYAAHAAILSNYELFSDVVSMLPHNIFTFLLVIGPASVNTDMLYLAQVICP